MPKNTDLNSGQYYEYMITKEKKENSKVIILWNILTETVTNLKHNKLDRDLLNKEKKDFLPDRSPPDMRNESKEKNIDNYMDFKQTQKIPKKRN